MYERNHHPGIQRANTGSAHLTARIDWLRAEAARTEPTARARREAEEVARLSMRAPLTPAQSFARFGMLLGLLPPAAIFERLFGHEMLPLSLVMNAVCCAVGGAAGGYLFRQVQDETSDFRLPPWARMLLAAILHGFGWGVVTGATGGVLFFGFGAVFGIIFAIPVGIIGYLLFTALHALFARRGFIESSRLWPIAFAVSATIAALILG